MALHMMLVRIRPDAPTSRPVTIRMVLATARPAAQAATPEYELSSAITTGMSAPPMEIVAQIPKLNASAIDTYNHSGLPGSVANK